MFFASVFTSKNGLQTCKALLIRGKVWSKEDILLVEENQVCEHLSKLGICQSMAPDRVHP